MYKIWCMHLSLQKHNALALLPVSNKYTFWIWYQIKISFQVKCIAQSSSPETLGSVKNTWYTTLGLGTPTHGKLHLVSQSIHNHYNEFSVQYAISVNYSRFFWIVYKYLRFPQYLCLVTFSATAVEHGSASYAVRAAHSLSIRSRFFKWSSM